MNALVPLHPLVTALQAHSTLEGSKWLELLYFHGGGSGFDSRRLHHQAVSGCPKRFQPCCEISYLCI